LMWTYYELVTDRTAKQIAELKSKVQSGKLHPMDAKMRLAEEIVRDFQGPDAGKKAAENFQRVFRDRQTPTEMEEIRVVRRDGTLVHSSGVVSTQTPKWCQLVAYLRQAESVAEATRLIEQGAFEVDATVLNDPATRIDATVPGAYKVRLGKKRFFRLVVE
jgi:tyrosyl-tRNA synthetase